MTKYRIEFWLLASKDFDSEKEMENFVKHSETDEKMKDVRLFEVEETRKEI